MELHTYLKVIFVTTTTPDCIRKAESHLRNALNTEEPFVLSYNLYTSVEALKMRMLKTQSELQTSSLVIFIAQRL